MYAWESDQTTANEEKMDIWTSASSYIRSNTEVFILICLYTNRELQPIQVYDMIANNL